MVVGEFIDDFERGAKGFGITIRQICVLENFAEERRDARVFRHPRDGLSVEVQGFMTAQAGAHEPCPAVTGELPCEKRARAAKFFAFGVQVIHELVDQGNGDLFDLALWVGDFADKNVASGVNTAFGFGVEHNCSRQWVSCEGGFTTTTSQTLPRPVLLV